MTHPDVLKVNAMLDSIDNGLDIIEEIHGIKPESSACESLKQTETFITTYATLANDYYVLPLALWAAATHVWDAFDCFPYLVITAYVKRAGKTRLMELLNMITQNGRTFSADSPASMFRSIVPDEDNAGSGDFLKPTMFIDEAEKLNQEAHPAREFLNKGYKRGQTITRVKGNDVVDMECFCPKCFVLIGDVYDTLRDRSIVVTMRRRSPIEASNETKFRRATVEPEAEVIRGGLREAIAEHREAIAEAYADMSLSFLNDRDEELWLPLFAICKVLCPSRIDELTKAAVDISTEKTAPRRNFRDLIDTEEEKADNAEAGVLLLRDMLILTEHRKHITTVELIEKLRDIPTSPWRAFRGLGLMPQDVAKLLDIMNVHPKTIRIKAGKNARQAMAKGYKREDLVFAAKLIGLKQ